MPKNPSPEPASILDTVNMLDTMTTDSSDSDSEVEPPLSIRLYSTKPRNLVQRRATITGASPTTKHGIDIEQFWKELKQEHSTTFQLRDKAASCAHGLDNVPINIRPQTCLGLESAKRRKKTDEQVNDKKVQTEKLIDAEDTTHLDDAKERITFMQSCSDGAASKDTNREHLQALTDNIGNSNNLNNTTVPLDECNNFINDACSISKNALGDKESETRYVKERGKLDKSYSTPAYDLSDTENKEDRKLALLQGPFYKLDLPIHCSNSVSSSNLTKTDVCMFTDSADHRKLKDTSKEHKEVSAKRCGNVAQKVSNIEKQIAHENADESIRVFGVPKELESHKNTVRIAINDINLRNNIEETNQSDIEYNISDVSTCDKKLNAKCICFKNSACNCQENTDCSNSEMLNDEGICNNNNSNSTERDEMSQKYGQILQTVDCASTQHTKLLENKSSISREGSIEVKILSSNNVNSLEDHLPSVIHNISKIQINTTPQAKEIKSADSSLAHATVQSCRYIELPKVESVRKYENKSHMTPPEPPPRKYYTKQVMPDLKLNNTSKIPEDLEKPQVPERPGLRREFKKTDLNLPTNHVRSNSRDYQDRKDFSDMGALNYPEHSMDFIDESPTINLNDTKFTQSEVSLYNENYDRSREEKHSFEKYEPFVEKFACSSQSLADCCKPDYSPRNFEYPDGVMHSKQLTSYDLKPKLSEKDKSFEKSVVNRAMMVARSIGLHGTLSKSNSSPRSSRKRNMLLASKYN